ncbi:SapC family protein [Polymorphobacter fuscus]|uniref:Peptide ABC transporter permease n=1 Tax=Sandarakinorhabdus fusca TaxID=1439888 RepID=A0A7C9GP37_9SPHN|nr:SapC family protein [Polymorphobacter fuscus]KAB7648829.1 SapC family protein [Polymorphobacter fuscus]MQT16410.1 peptide ABC transporter permease [Polymorphobacter fuscus]NJC07301.1 hypothetical protein [Polymorphobacter fuscus]
MADTIILDNIAHADLCVVPRAGAAFGDGVNQMLVFPTEFAAVQREFPILFARDGAGAWQAVAITGLDRDDNLFLDGDRWTSAYVPAVQRRGPFAIGFRDAARTDPVIHVDLSDARVRPRGGEGVPVFLPHGGNAPYLDAIITALQTIHLGVAATAPLFALLEDLDLIEPVALQVSLSETEHINFEGYATIDGDRLAALDGAGLERLARAGHLATVVHVIASLDNIARLVERRHHRHGRP